MNEDIVVRLLQMYQSESASGWKLAGEARDEILALRAALAATRAERDALRAELAEVKSDADESSVFLSQANDDLSEARRVLRLVDKQARRECPVCFSPGWTHKEGCALAAVLAQEGQ